MMSIIFRQLLSFFFDRKLQILEEEEKAWKRQLDCENEGKIDSEETTLYSGTNFTQFNTITEIALNLKFASVQILGGFQKNFRWISSSI